MWVSDDLGYLRLDSTPLFWVDDWGFVRLDAKAGDKNCTPGKTIPCGNRCRTPANCVKAKNETSQGRVQRLGKEELGKFADAKRKAKGLGDRETVAVVRELEKEIFPDGKPTSPSVTASGKRITKKSTKRTKWQGAIAPQQATESQAKSADKKTAPIKKYEDFKTEITDRFNEINEDFGMDNFIPISRLRKAMGDRVGRKEFDDWMFKMQEEDTFAFMEEEVKGGSQQDNDDCLVSKMGTRRCYARNLQPKPKSTPKKENGGPSLDEFKSMVSSAFDEADKEGENDGLVPIYKIRRKIGEKVERSRFNEMMFELQNNDEYEFVEGTVEDNSPDKLEDCLVGKVSGRRCYARRAKPADTTPTTPSVKQSSSTSPAIKKTEPPSTPTSKTEAPKVSQTSSTGKGSLLEKLKQKKKGQSTPEAKEDPTSSEQANLVKKVLKTTDQEAEEIASAVVNFTVEGYKPIRAAQTGGKYTPPPPKEESLKQAEMIEKYISAAPKHKGEIYRGLNFTSQDQADKFMLANAGGMQMNAMSSFTSDSKVASRFAQGTELDKAGEFSVLLVVRGNKSGASVAEFSEFPEEGEVLVPSKAKYKMVEQKRKGKSTVLVMEEI